MKYSQTCREASTERFYIISDKNDLFGNNNENKSNCDKCYLLARKF